MLHRIPSQPKVLTGKTGSKEKRSDSATVNAAEGFGELLDSARVESADILQKMGTGIDSSFDRLFEQLSLYERNLIDYPTESNFESYQQKVRELLSQLLSKSYQIRLIRDARSKSEFEVVQEVDQKLGEIFTQIARHRPDVRGVLRHMGYIKGILLDLKV